MSAHVVTKVDGQDQRDKKSRAAYYDDAGVPVPLPHVHHAAQYLIDAMNDLGPVRAESYGIRAADWPEISAFIAATNDISEPWEAKALRRMCSAYADGLMTGEKPLGIPPMERKG